MDLQGVLREKIAAEFEKRKETNSRYSLRGMAEHLNIDASLLRKFLRGERRLGAKSLLVLASRLQLEPQLQQLIYSKFSRGIDSQTQTRQNENEVQTNLAMAFDATQMPRVKNEIEKFNVRVYRMRAKNNTCPIYTLQISFTPVKTSI